MSLKPYSNTNISDFRTIALSLSPFTSHDNPTTAYDNSNWHHYKVVASNDLTTLYDLFLMPIGKDYKTPTHSCNV